MKYLLILLALGCGGKGLAQSDSTSKLDTTRVLMLMCDTAKHVSAGFSSDPQSGGLVLWGFGYMVTKYVHGTNQYGFFGGMDLAGYLDQDKKPLRKSVIVWQNIRLESKGTFRHWPD